MSNPPPPTSIPGPGRPRAQPAHRLAGVVEVAVLAGIVVAAGWALAILLAACRLPEARPLLSPPAAPSADLWCAAGESSSGEALLGCAATEATCELERAQARRWGAIAGIAAVGDCRRTSVR